MALQIQKVLKSSMKLANSRTFYASAGLDGAKTLTNKLHLAVQRDYPIAEQLPIPANIDVTETARFSPLRNRDITSSAMNVHHEMNAIDVTLDQMVTEAKTDSIIFNDAHLGSYDRHSSVNLSSVMQSTVPEPFGGNNKCTHLNMPGGSWGMQTKYLSHELNSAHYTELRQEVRSDWSQYNHEAPKGITMSGMKSVFHCSLLKPNCLNDFLIINKRFISLSASHFNEQAPKSPGSPPGEAEASPPVKETAQSKLKKAIKEYGSTVLVFHIGISLVSLGMFYGLVSSGLDLTALLEKVNLADKAPKFAENASTFVIAYAIHKLFAPVRISITLGSTPFIVRFLRKKGFLKK